jgi:hypothetical protein
MLRTHFRRWSSAALSALLPLCLSALAAAQVITPKDAIPPDQLGRRPKAGDQEQRPELVLPSGQSPRRSGSEPAPKASGAESASPSPGTASGDPSILAVELLQQLIDAPTYDERRSRAISAQWIALGEPGLRAARAGLGLDEPAALVTAARTLAQAGGEAEHELLRARLFEPLPRDASAILLRALRQSAPSFFGAAELVALLDHQTAAMRAAAGRELERSVRAAEELGDDQRADLAAALSKALASRRTETRARTLELLVDFDPNAAQAVLLAHLEDPTPRVALRAAQLCARLPGEDLQNALIERAFATPALFRDQAYALLALMEIEDRSGRALVSAERVPMLLANLAEKDPLASGVAACALAGVGFRGTVTPEASEGEANWFDLRVPHRLVGEVSAANFHQDIGSVSEAARRRLQLISGVDHGADGPAWRGWWIEAAKGFQSRRAVLRSEPADAPRLEVKLQSVELPGGAVWLLGPEARFDAGEARAVRCLTAERAASLMEALRAEGLFSAQRLPIGTLTGFESEELEIRIGPQVKRFAFEADAAPDWYRSAQRLVEAELEQQRWQAFIDPQRFPDARAFFAAEASWWQEPRDQAERARRLCELCLAALPSLRGSARDSYLNELERLSAAAEPGAGPLGQADFETLLKGLEDELNAGRRVEQLTRLALDSLGTPAAGSDQAPLEGARRLLTTLWTLYGEPALPVATELVQRVGLALARELVFEPQARLRALAGPPLAQVRDGEDVGLFRLLLSDADFGVQAAAVRAAGEAGRGDLREEVAMRARLGANEVRCAALEALGNLGGGDSLEVMIAGLSSPEGAVQAAAVSGLAQLGDPQSLPILSSILDRGTQSPLYAKAVEGLVALGPSAHGELLRLAEDVGSPGRRGGALILARASVGQSASALIDLLTANPRDRELLDELAFLTVVDLRSELDPAEAYFQWLEGQESADAFEWLRAAQERAGLVPTPAGGLDRGGSRAGAFSLWRGLGSVDAVLAERSRRELERLLGETLAPLPPRGMARDLWRQSLLTQIDERWPG